MSAARSARLIAALRGAASFGALAVLGITATGCSIGGGGAAGGAAKLRVWRIDQPKDVVAELGKDFAGENPEARLSYSSKSLDTYELDALKSLTARQGPDVWSLPGDWVGDHQKRLLPIPEDFFTSADGKTVRTAKEVITSAYPPGIAEQLIAPDGKVYGLPSSVDALRLYTNQAFFDLARQDYSAKNENASEATVQPVLQLLSRPPRTWNDVVALTPYLTRREGGAFSRSAIALGAVANVPAAGDVLQLLMYQNGGDIVSSDRTRALFHIPITTPAGISVRPGQDALTFYASFAQPGSSSYTWNEAMPPALDALAQGKVGMVIAYRDFGVELKKKYPQFTFDEGPVPQISSSPLQKPVNFIRPYIEGVTQVADSKGLAFSFLKKYVNVPYVNDIARQQGLRTAFSATLQDDAEDFLSQEILTGRYVYKQFRVQFDDAFRQMVIDVNGNGLSSSKALDSAAEKINGLLARDPQ